LGEGKVPYILNWALDGGELSGSCLLVRIISVYFTRRPFLVCSLYRQVSFYTRVMLLKKLPVQTQNSHLKHCIACGFGDWQPLPM